MSCLHTDINRNVLADRSTSASWSSSWSSRSMRYWTDFRLKRAGKHSLRGVPGFLLLPLDPSRPPAPPPKSTMNVMEPWCWALLLNSSSDVPASSASATAGVTSFTGTSSALPPCDGDAADVLMQSDEPDTVNADSDWLMTRASPASRVNSQWTRKIIR